MQIIKCFEVLGNTDTTEGRGPMKVVARFTTREAATLYVKSKAYAQWCVMGCQNLQYDLNNIKEVTLTILERVDELEQMELEELKARALAKLTDKEKRALGLDI